MDWSCGKATVHMRTSLAHLDTFWNISTHLDATCLLPFCFGPALNIVTGRLTYLHFLLGYIGVIDNYVMCVWLCVCILRCVQICHHMHWASGLAPSFWADKEFATELWWTSSVQSFNHPLVKYGSVAASAAVRQASIVLMDSCWCCSRFSEKNHIFKSMDPCCKMSNLGEVLDLSKSQYL